MVSNCCGALPWKLETYELMGICSECKEYKSDADFIKMGMQRHSMCDPCRKTYQREYQQKLKKRRNQYGSK